jgi:hypothetical protein
MGSGRTDSTTADLFSTASPFEPSSSLASETPNATASARHVLPKNLHVAIRYLGEKELEQLAAAVLLEQARRGIKPAAAGTSHRKQRIEAVEAHLTTGKLNVIRAAFKAGVKPAQIAKQLGVSLPDVRQALILNEQKS